MRVVKIGGSLLDHAPRIMPVFLKYSVLIVPGGGVFADTLRKVYREHRISDEAAHDMAVLATQQYGHYLSDISKIQAITSLEHLPRQAVILPLNTIKGWDAPKTWDHASDTMACYIAKRLGKKEFLKLTDVDGIIINGRPIKNISAGKLLNTTTCLDKSLPLYLQTWKMDCTVVNGTSVENIEKALRGKPVGTRVSGG
jgi:aspartokinase-like uncharacterized kinase